MAKVSTVSPPPVRGNDWNFDQIHATLRDNIINKEVNKTIEAVKFFKESGDIGERELRKVLNQHLTGVSDYHQTCLIESLSKLDSG